MRTNQRSLHPRIWSHKFRILRRIDKSADRQPLVPTFTTCEEIWDGMLETNPEVEAVTDGGRLSRWPNIMYTQMRDAENVARIGDQLELTYPAAQSGTIFGIEGIGKSNDMFLTFDLVRLQ